MIYGHVRDGFPRISLQLPGRSGDVRVEFLIDTGFEGELSLPSTLAAQIDSVVIGQRPIQVADGTRSYRPLIQVDAEWND